MPKLADTLVEGTVTRWLKREGEPVHKGEPLVEIETDKVNTELEAPADGVLTEVLVPAGQTVEVGRVLARISDTAQTLVASAPAGTERPFPLPTPDRQEGLTPMRRRIAERMQEARATIPQGACVRLVDVTAIDRRGLSWTASFVKALALAAAVSEVGVAVEVPAGLLVPVVRAANRRSLKELSEIVTDLATRAREGRLRPDEVTGGEFTVTNVGSVGTLMAFPLVVPGQPGILAPGTVVGGRCYITLCYDRRAFDDYAADRLLARIEQRILEI
jgi:pyruvate/2-oxoglutarate dehydrogenase complex dihydrolipoamide acyltransferase (E2) component